MSDELWNQKLTRENIRDFYMSTVVMVYSSCFSITKEATRCENAIIKSYLDIYSKRNNVAGDRVIYEFGDILLANAKNIVAQYPLPQDMTFEDRLLIVFLPKNALIPDVLSNTHRIPMARTMMTRNVMRPARPGSLADLGSFIFFFVFLTVVTGEMLLS